MQAWSKLVLVMMYHYMNLIELDILEVKQRVITMDLVRDLYLLCPLRRF